MVTMWPPTPLDGEGPRYLLLVQSLTEAIASGQLPEGSRLPTHRDLADRLAVTVGTVSRAYGEAARRGLVSGEVGRGTFVRRQVPRYEARPGAAPGLVDLSSNHPPLLEDRALKDAVERGLLDLVKRDELHALLDYPADGGNPPRPRGGGSLDRTHRPGRGARRRARLLGQPARDHHRARHSARARRPAGDRRADLPGPEGGGQPASPAHPGPAHGRATASGPTPSKTPAAREASARSTSCPPSTTRRARSCPRPGAARSRPSPAPTGSPSSRTTSTPCCRRSGRCPSPPSRPSSATT